MIKLYNCPCGAAPIITWHDETDDMEEHTEINCEACWGIHVESETEYEARVDWNKKVKSVGVI